MSKWEVIKNLNFKQTGALFVWFLQHPIFMYATFIATVHTIRVAERVFPKIHGLHNKANAFRHAFWNVMIAKECHKFSTDVDKVLNWTKKITDWHEEFSPNAPMAKLMDLHNNAIGRKSFLAFKDKSNIEITKTLILKMDDAVKINKTSQIDKINNLVFLED
tara:strand:+ start:44162 stop:44647 length:486 start_codon:yes stop_codon:yes gene_type:complete